LKQKAPGSAGGFLFLLTNLEIAITNKACIKSYFFSVMEIKKREVNMRVNLYISIEKMKNNIKRT